LVKPLLVKGLKSCGVLYPTKKIRVFTHMFYLFYIKENFEIVLAVIKSESTITLMMDPNE
jgi:hypothetical protein